MPLTPTILKKLTELAADVAQLGVIVTNSGEDMPIIDQARLLVDIDAICNRIAGLQDMVLGLVGDEGDQEAVSTCYSVPDAALFRATFE